VRHDQPHGGDDFGCAVSCWGQNGKDHKGGCCQIGVLSLPEHVQNGQV
jgi:hypothetical protein